MYCNGHNHSPDCQCGWGGVNYGTTWASIDHLFNEFGWRSDAIGVWWQFSGDVREPSPCPYCRKDVFFIRHNGGSFWVDLLGWPWPKHECFDSATAFNPWDRHDPRRVFQAKLPSQGRLVELTELFRSRPDTQLGVVGFARSFGKNATLVACNGRFPGGRPRRVFIIPNSPPPQKMVGSLVAIPGDVTKILILSGGGSIEAFDPYGKSDPATAWYKLWPNEAEVGQIVHHKKFGMGTIAGVEQLEDGQKVEVYFSLDAQPRKLLTRLAEFAFLKINGKLP